MIYRKKIIAFILSLLLVTTIVQPLPARAAGDIPSISRVYTKIDGQEIEGIICGAKAVIEGENFANRGILVYIKSSATDPTPVIAEIDAIYEGESGTPDTIEIVVPFKDRNPEGRLIVVLKTADEITVEYEASHKVTIPEIKSIEPELGGRGQIGEKEKVYLPSPSQDTLIITGTQFDARYDSRGVPRLKAYIRQMREYELTVLSVRRKADTTDFELVVKTPRGIPEGPATLVVKNPDGGTATMSDLEFIRAPELSSINPTFGIAGDLIEVRGSNLDLLKGEPKEDKYQAKNVKLFAGPNQVENLTIEEVDTDGKKEYVLSGEVPAGSDNTSVDMRLEYTYKFVESVSITIKSILPGAFYYRGAEVQPIIKNIEPRTVPLKGGEIKITGEGFLGIETEVFIDGVKAENVYFQDTKTILLKVPEGTEPGWRSIRIVNTNSQKEAFWKEGFLYEAESDALAILSVSPNEAPLGKLETITLTCKAKNIDFEQREEDGKVAWGKVYFGGIQGTILSLRKNGDTVEVIAQTPSYVWQEGPDEQAVSVSILLYREEGLSSGAQWNQKFYFYRPPIVPAFVSRVDRWVEEPEPEYFSIPIFNQDTGTPEGPTSGGSTVIILATGVLGKDNLKVYFGSQEAEIEETKVVGRIIAEAEQDISVHWIKVIVPPGPKDREQVPVTLVNFVNDPPPPGPPPAYGRWYGIATKEDGFYYRTNKMILSSFRPTDGPASGGITVEIVGNNFGWSQDAKLLREKTKVFFGPSEVPTEHKEIILGTTDEGGATADTIRVKLPPQGEETPRVQVAVETPFGKRVVPGTFNYYPVPEKLTIEEVSPLWGTAKGGTELVIKGTGFEPTDTVWIGDKRATNVKVTLEEVSELDEPTGNEEPETPDGSTSADNGPGEPEPDPDQEPGDSEEDPKDDKSSFITVLTCKTPPGEPGPATIKVEKRGGSYAVADQKFIYLSAPEITSVTPASGTVKGGTWVLLRGKGFLDQKEVAKYPIPIIDEENGNENNGNETGNNGESNEGPMESEPKNSGSELIVKFGGEPADEVTYLSPIEVAVKTPEGPHLDRNATVDIELINPDAYLADDEVTGRAIKANGYEYRVPQTSPEIKSLDPTLGPITGGTKVVITGSDFREDAAVFFKWKPAAKVTRIDHNTLEVITPPAAEDWVDEKDGVDVTVINVTDGGQSEQSEVSKFQYVYPRTRPEFHSIVPNQGSVDGGTLVTIRGYDLGNVEDKEEAGIELIWPTVYFGNDKATVVGLNENRTMLRVKTPPHAAGTVDIRIVNPDSATVTANNAYTYRYITTEPRIQSVEPKIGCASGGTPVVIAGSGFSTGAKVFFNDQAAKVDIAKSSETTLFVYSPPGKAGEKADITVLNPDGASHTLTEAFEYLPDPKLQPRITQIIPNKGPITGGTVVDIWGVNLRHGTNQQLTVLLGHQPVEVVNSFPDPDPNKAKEDYVQYVQIEIPPAEKPGSVDVSVINADGGVATVPSGFTYTEVAEPIELDAIVPSKGPYLVNIPAQINGSGFLSGAKVFLGGQEIAGCEAINEGTAIIFTIPAAPEREDDLSLDVVVMNPNGATARLKDGFTYVAEPKSEPKITQAVPGSGRTTGGTPVVVYGQGFIEQTLTDGSKELPALFFGSRLAAKTIFVSGEQLSAITPPGPVGPVNVTVINPDGAMVKLVSGYIYEDKPGPQITSISPTSGPSSGGTEVTIVGSQFDPGVKVLFGNTSVTSLQRKSDTELVVITPEGDLGAVNVTVTNPDGSSYTLPDAFTYVGPPKPPEGLAARAVSANTIELSWVAAIGAASYEIYVGDSRSDQYFHGSTTGEVYGATGPNEDEQQILYYYVQDLEPDTRYYFSVRAVNKDGVSGQTWTASARTLKRSAREPEDIPAATDFTITRNGSAGVVITLPPTVLKDSRIRLDLMKPEYENERTFTIILPAGEVDRRSIIYLSAPRLKFELPVRAVNSVEVRSLSRREREQASVHVTIEEARGSDITTLLKKIPSGWTAATPIYRLEVKLTSGGQEKKLAWLEERANLTTKFDFAAAVLQESALYYYDPIRDIWTPTGYFSPWSTDAALNRPGYWIVLSQTL